MRFEWRTKSRPKFHSWYGQEASETSKGKRTSKEILKNVQETLETAELGLRDFVNGTSDRKLAGLRNLVVWGRAVTNVLQALRSTESEFDAWYSRFLNEMRSDPLLKYFYDLRTILLKKGILDTKVKIHIKELTLPFDPKLSPPPPSLRAISKRISLKIDAIGGLYWEIELQNGSQLKYYVKLPIDVGSASAYFPNPPSNHMGKDISGYSIEKLGIMFMDYLRKMVQEAKKRFE